MIRVYWQTRVVEPLNGRERPVQQVEGYQAAWTGPREGTRGLPRGTYELRRPRRNPADFARAMPPQVRDALVRDLEKGGCLEEYLGFSPVPRNTVRENTDIRARLRAIFSQNDARPTERVTLRRSPLQQEDLGLLIAVLGRFS